MTLHIPGAGWYEFEKEAGGTSYIIRIFENGEDYIPNPEVTSKDFLEAVMFERAWKLVRTEARIQTWPKPKY